VLRFARFGVLGLLHHGKIKKRPSALEMKITIGHNQRCHSGGSAGEASG
jgi:hypothetical protein